MASIHTDQGGCSSSKDYPPVRVPQDTPRPVLLPLHVSNVEAVDSQVPGGQFILQPPTHVAD